MHLYRIAKTHHILDLSGNGARLYGGRWNRKGTAMVYTSESIALGALETLAHFQIPYAPSDLSVLELFIPDGISAESIDIKKLPVNWNTYPALDSLADLGTEWARSNRSLLLKVPSVIIPREYNLLINPAHPDFAQIKHSKPESFLYDQRIHRLLTKAGK